MDSGGTLDVFAHKEEYDVKATEIDMTGVVGSGHREYPHGIQNFDFKNQSQYAAMKLVGGHKITIDNVTINYTGASTSKYNKWLFHTDGHNDRGESTYILNDGTKVNIDGKYLVLYTSQYHSGTSQNANMGFVNNGTITSKGSNNIGWIALNEGGNLVRQQYFYNKSGNITMKGESDIFAYIMSPVARNNGGWTLINDSNIKLTGDKQFGIIVSDKYSYNAAEILLNKPIDISGKETTGVVFKGWMDLDGDAPFSQSTADNIVTPLPKKSRESIINLNLAGSKNTGIYFESPSSNTFNLNDYTINSTGEKNTGVFIKDGKINLGTTNTGGTQNTININTGANKNIGVFVATNDNVNSGAKITINSNESTGIYAKDGTGTVTNTGQIIANGKSVKAMIADNTRITNTGVINVDGSALNTKDGAVGLVAMNNGTLTSTGGGTIKVKDSASIAAFAQSGGVLDLTGGTLSTKKGSFNTYAQGGTIKLNGTTIKTGQESLAFFSDTTGKIEFTGATTTDIAGGSSANLRGTAFYFTGNGYSSFNPTTVGTWITNTFGSTLPNLTLNMDKGSRLFIASDIAMNLSNTSAANLFSGVGPTINGTDYKTFMLYLSKLAINQSVNLDNVNDAYNKLEIASSSIDNNNANTIKGTKSGQVAIAQENKTGNRSKVILNNKGIIELSGNNSTGMYASFGELNNKGGAKIKIGNSSTALYGLANSILTNDGEIHLGNDSTGMYSEGSTTTDLINKGLIKTTKNNSIAMLYKPASVTATGIDMLKNIGTIEMTGDKNVALYGTEITGAGANYEIANSGTIIMGDSDLITSPNVALYSDSSTKNLKNSGTITMGKNTIGLYGHKVTISGGNLTVGDKATAIYSQSKDVNLLGGTIKVGKDDATAVYSVGNTQHITNTGTTFDLGDNSFGFVNVGKGNTIDSSVATQTLKNGSIYIYSNDKIGNVINSTNITSSGKQNYGIYSAGTVTNSGNMNLSSGIGNVGMYSVQGGTVTNSGIINIGGADPTNNIYGIGIAAGYSWSDEDLKKPIADRPKLTTGNIINNGTINVNGENSIGIYATGVGSTVKNAGNIILNANKTIGMYIDEGISATNSGTIKTGTNPTAGVIGVVLGKGATLINTGTIKIDTTKGAGVLVKGGTINNTGNIEVSGIGTKKIGTLNKPTTKGLGGIEINAPAGATIAKITVNGKPVTPTPVVTTMKNPKTVSATSVGLYVNTSSDIYTKPIKGLENITSEADLIIGAEATKSTTSKYIVINDSNILNPYNKAILNSGVSKWNIYSGSLTWLATPILNPQDGSLTSVYMAKIPYTEWAGNKATPVDKKDTFNFLNGLDQRYGVEKLGSRENKLFNKLNEIGNNEEILLFQATDEMMGHQYANVQQRIYETGNVLNKEFKYLKREWDTKSKDSNKIKVFGMNGNYKTDTAGIIDYKNHGQGFAYLHENETIKLGETTGWYGGFIQNHYKFEDIGKSNERNYQVKLGIFKSNSYDQNNSLNWTVSGETFVGYNKMHRKFLVVDEIFNAKSNYWSYGLGFNNRLSKTFRLTEKISIKPYGGLKLEYGRFQKIKEKYGEIKLEVKANDYYSIKPELGIEFGYKHLLKNNKTLTARIGLVYENELGQVTNTKNKARVANTNADWFNIRGEKEDRKGNLKTNLNIGLENEKYGVTTNIGYDTKGNNIIGGLGLRIIF